MLSNQHSVTGNPVCALKRKHDTSVDRQLPVLVMQPAMHARINTLAPGPASPSAPALHLQALIAGGTFNGELYVWDLSQEGDVQRGRSDVLLDVRHTEPVIAITWQYNINGKAVQQALKSSFASHISSGTGTYVSSLGVA